jgi:hypothetical protein
LPGYSFHRTGNVINPLARFRFEQAQSAKKGLRIATLQIVRAWEAVNGNFYVKNTSYSSAETVILPYTFPKY